jgi:DNA-binding SARP family transcriptional activator
VSRAQQQRQVFTQLAVAAGKMVRVSDMCAELWDGEPPSSAVTVVQTYVVALRKQLARAMGRSTREISNDVLVTHPDAYTLNIDPATVDAHRFETMHRLGSRALAAGRPDVAADHLAEALDLWRGPVLADMRTGPLLELDVTRLTLARLVATEQRIEADLQLGRHYEVLAELADLTARQPLDETLHQQYMLALHRTGRRTKALQVYQRLRSVLSSELGLGPCRSVQRVHQAILRADPELDHTGQLVLA